MLCERCEIEVSEDEINISGEGDFAEKLCEECYESDQFTVLEYTDPETGFFHRVDCIDDEELEAELSYLKESFGEDFDDYELG